MPPPSRTKSNCAFPWGAESVGGRSSGCGGDCKGDNTGGGSYNSGSNVCGEGKNQQYKSKVLMAVKKKIIKERKQARKLCW